MNKSRRKALDALQNRLQAIQLAAMFEEIASIAADLETLRDEEQDSFDNLPESLQDGEKGNDMQEAISQIEQAMELLSAFEELAENADEAFSMIEDAKGVQS